MRDWTTLLTPSEITAFQATAQNFNAYVEEIVAECTRNAMRNRITNALSVLPPAAQSTVLQTLDATVTQQQQQILTAQAAQGAISATPVS